VALDAAPFELVRRDKPEQRIIRVIQITIAVSLN
jgi:hypothetical protein